MVFSKHDSISLRLDNQTIHKVSNIKFLGINIDNTLKWETHFNGISKKLASSLFAIRTVSLELNDVRISLEVYHALFESYLRYGVIFWGYMTVSRCNILFLLQKRAIRIICKADRIAHCKPLFKFLKVLTFYDVIAFETVTFLHNKQLEKRGDIHSYATRIRDDLNLPQSRSTVSKFSLYHYGKSLYNAIPLRIRLLDTRRFKRTLKVALIESVNYSFNELFTCTVPLQMRIDLISQISQSRINK